MTVRGAKARAEIRAAIEATADKEGIVTPDGILSAARDKASVLHAEFEWDDSTAAHQHRLAQARSLIREITFEVADIPRRAISEVSYVHQPGSSGQAYVPLGRAARDKEMARGILEAEFARVEGAINRAREVAAVLSLSAELNALLKDVIAIKRRAIAA